MPSTTSEALGILREAEAIRVVGKCNEVPWYCVLYEGNRNYIHADYLTLDGVEGATNVPAPTIGPTPTPVPGTVVAELNLKMVGDNLIHSILFNRARTEDGFDFSYIFTAMKDEIEEADLAIINQETIFIADNSKVSSYPTFGTPDEMGKAIVEAGFDIVLLK